MSSVGAGETHTESFLQKDACVFPSTSNRSVCATMHTTAVPHMSAGGYSQPYYSPPIIPVNSQTKMNYIPGVDLRLSCRLSCSDRKCGNSI